MMETASAIAFASAEAVADVSVECYSCALPATE